MRIEKQKLKTVVLSLALAGMLWPASLFAQGGMLKPEAPTEERSLMGRNGNGMFSDVTLQNFGENQDGLSLQNFGEPEAPLGSGWLVLMGAGLGYAALKKRKTTKTNK